MDGPSFHLSNHSIQAHGMMKTSILVTLSLLSSLTLAFEGTYPLAAFTSNKLNSLESLNPLNPNSKSLNPFKSSTKQSTFQAPNSENDAGDLCSLDNILVFNAPGLHNSDLASLPIDESPFGTLKSLLSQAKQDGRALLVPYIKKSNSHSHTRHSPNHRNSALDKALKHFVTGCGATVEKVNEKNFWGGEKGRTLKVVGVEGLDQWALTGENARANRKEIMRELDGQVMSHLQTLSAPFLIIISDIPSLPSSFSSPSSSSSSSLHKRQEYDLDVEEELAEEFDADLAAWSGSIIATDPFKTQQAPNGTKSIFEVKKNSGLLHRYVFFTPPLIFALALTLLILIPVLVFTSTALTTTETFQGLEGKMVGSVGLDPSKA